MTKAALRKKYIKRRQDMLPETIDIESIAIANLCLQLPIWSLTTYHLFLSIEKQKEIDTSYILHILQGRDKTVMVSKSNFDTFEMTHYLLQENTKLVLSKFGIPEPESGIILPATAPDVVFVPLLAFDKSGNRLGYGKGFYDRFLGHCKPDTIFVGLSLFEAEQTIPNEKNDITLHYTVTPTKIYSF